MQAMKSIARLSHKTNMLQNDESYVILYLGRCKSAFHKFLSRILEKVADRVEVRGQKARQMLLPHCTWDKFGELLSENGARSLSLFDELMSFFATMNMYSSHKMQLSDTREFQDFLQLFTGKSKTRETGKLDKLIQQCEKETLIVLWN